MDSLNELSYIWESDKDNYVLVKDEMGYDFFCIEGIELGYLLIEDDELHHAVVTKMLESGNVVYNSMDELDEVLGVNKQNLILQLYKARKLSSNEECELFDDAMIKLQMSIKISDVYELCKVFCDDTEDEEVMFGLVHLIEQLLSEEYLECIAKCSPEMVDAHEWAMTLNKRILNSKKYFRKYVDVISNMEEIYKTKILELIIDIKKENPKRFGGKVDYVLEKAVSIEGKNPKKYSCPCCGKETLSLRGEYDICANCNWEDDGNESEDTYSSVNHMTLGQGKKNYLLYGRCEK